jgi:ABC-type uncharacterized transport system involved in gliding motility auxiliary subunit
MLSEWTVTPVSRDTFLPVLAAWGIETGTELVLDISCFRLTLDAQDATSPEYKNYPLWVTLLPGFTPPHALTRAFLGMNVFWASPLTLYPTEDTRIVPLLCTSSASWLMHPEVDREQTFVTNPFSVPSSGAQAGKPTQQHTVGAALEGTLSGYYTVDGNTPTRVVCVADQYFVSNAMMEYTSSVQNLDFLVNAVIWLKGEENLLALKQRVQNTALYKLDDAQLVAAEIPVLALTGILIPALIPLCGVVVYARRKRR